MKVEVICFSSVGDHGVRCESLEIAPKISVPQGFVLEGGERKFIILIEDNKLCVAIGPPLSNGYYYHEDLLRVCGVDEKSIFGGGSIKVSIGENSSRVTFGGRSGDYGVYDYRTLAPKVRSAIEKELGCRVSFEWQG